jgi:hypothetical protein
MLDRLRGVLSVNGKLTAEIIQQSRLCPGSATYCSRFGGLLNVYARLGYSQPEHAAALVTRQRLMLIRELLIETLLDHFPDRLREVRRKKRFRSKVRDRRTGLLIAVIVARCYPTKKGTCCSVLTCLSGHTNSRTSRYKCNNMVGRPRPARPAAPLIRQSTSASENLNLFCLFFVKDL